MQFRIGINLGDVIHDETRIYGDGINIAARLEGLADPGGVLVSSIVYDQNRGKLPASPSLDESIEMSSPNGAVEGLPWRHGRPSR